MSKKTENPENPVAVVTKKSFFFFFFKKKRGVKFPAEFQYFLAQNEMRTFRFFKKFSFYMVILTRFYRKKPKKRDFRRKNPVFPPQMPTHFFGIS